LEKKHKNSFFREKNSTEVDEIGFGDCGPAQFLQCTFIRGFRSGGNIPPAHHQGDNLHKIANPPD